jgi:asparagine synthetase B (glutamine-hydrolysing)
LRVPYLYHVLVEAAWGIPAAEKLQPGINKPALVKAVGHPLVEAAARKAKRGFTFPFAKWLARDAGAMREKALGAGPLNRRAVDGCWNAFERGRLHWSRAWATVVCAQLAEKGSQAGFSS